METTTTNPVTYLFDFPAKVVLDIMRANPHALGSPGKGYDYMDIGVRDLCNAEGARIHRYREQPAFDNEARLFVELTFASETDAVLFRLTHGDTFSNPRAVE